MVRVIILCMFALSIYAGEIINISYFPSKDKVDVLFSLDEPFKGKISLIDKNSYKISNIFLNRIEHKKFEQLEVIVSMLEKDSIEFKIIYPTKLQIKASVTAKGYGLRLRILGIKSYANSTLQLPQTQVRNFDIINYIGVILILIVLIVVLLIIKKRTLSKLPPSLQKDDYKMLYQKMIDTKNKIVLIEVFKKRYLLLLGANNNILLDNFSTQYQEELKDISSQNKFESLLDEKLESDYIQKASRLKDIDNV